ncbi:unnamed protein product, partial [Brenthis ino]
MNDMRWSKSNDTALLFVANSWNEVQDFAQLGSNPVSLWLKKNNLILNVDKTKYMRFIHSCGSYASNCYCPPIEEVNTIKCTVHASHYTTALVV